MNPNPFEQTFNKLKKSGLFKQFKDYESWEKKNQLTNLEKEIQAEVVENEKPRKRENFVDTLSPKDKKDFLYIFGEGVEN